MPLLKMINQQDSIRFNKIFWADPTIVQMSSKILPGPNLADRNIIICVGNGAIIIRMLELEYTCPSLHFYHIRRHPIA